MLKLQFIEQKMSEKNLSYRKMSQLMGFNSSGAVWKWVHGLNQIRATYLEKLAEILEVPVQDFFEQDNESQPTCKGGDCE